MRAPIRSIFKKGLYINIYITLLEDRAYGRPQYISNNVYQLLFLAYERMSSLVQTKEFEDFKKYVTDSGVIFDQLTNNEKREWRESFDKSKNNNAGEISFIKYRCSYY